MSIKAVSLLVIGIFFIASVEDFAKSPMKNLCFYLSLIFYLNSYGMNKHCYHLNNVSLSILRVEHRVTFPP